MVTTKRPENHPWQRSEPKKQPGILHRLSMGDPAAVADCAAIYGAYVSELAKYNSRSDEEANIVAAWIFDDINAFARSERGQTTEKSENELISQIAVRRIVKQRWDGRKAG